MPETEARLRAFESLCRERKIPLTSQRRTVLETLLARRDHPTADQLHQAVKARLPEVSRTTVYRVLDTLVKLGLARQIPHPTAVARFDANVDRHHHLVCRECDSVMDFPDDRVQSLACPPAGVTGFTIEDYSIQFTGLCASCTAGTRTGQAATPDGGE